MGKPVYRNATIKLTMKTDATPEEIANAIGTYLDRVGFRSAVEASIFALRDHKGIHEVTRAQVIVPRKKRK